MLRVAAVLGLLVCAYAYLLSMNTDTVLTQTRQLQTSYQSATATADRLAAGQ